MGKGLFQGGMWAGTQPEGPWVTGSPPQGGCATFLCQPLDVLKTRLMNSKGEYQVRAGLQALLTLSLCSCPRGGCFPLGHGGPEARRLSPAPF